jgi:hypothetical protein
MDDDRLSWLRQRLCLTLEMPVEAFDTYFDPQNIDNLHKIKEIFSKKHTAGSTVIFTCDKKTEQIEVEEEIVPIQKEADDDDIDAQPESIEVEPSMPAIEPTEPQPELIEGETVAPDPEPIKKITRMETRITSQLFMSVDRVLPEFHDRLSVYLVRSLNGDMPEKGNMSVNQYTGMLVDYFDLIVMAGDPLSCIANTMSKLYLPVIEKGQSEYTGLPELDDGVKHELTSNVVKLEQQLRTNTSSKGEQKLSMPKVNISDPKAVTDDDRREIEEHVERWTQRITRDVAEENSKSAPRNSSPLSEIDFWRQRSASLSTVYEQLTSPKLQALIQILAEKDRENPLLVMYNYHFSDLSKLYLEAKDNVKFLSTLERHFKHIEKGTFNTSKPDAYTLNSCI